MKKIIFLAIAFSFFQTTFAQLSNFTLAVTKTDETCLGNGTLNFNVSGTTAGSTIIYNIYRLPDVTTPIAVLSLNTFTGLNAGTYRVVAIQSIGALSGSQQQEITINNLIIPLAYQLTGEREICGNDGKITVNVTSGVALQYEIFQGPIIRPLQSSNVFSNLVAGQYTVRVFNDCGEGVTQTYTVLSGTAGLEIGLPSSYPDCTSSTINVNFGILNSPSNVIKYPLTVTITVFPPGGGTPINYNQTIDSGSETQIYFFQEIILYPNQTYSYNITVVDGCGNIHIRNGSGANSNTIPQVIVSNMSCTGYEIFIFDAQSAILIAAPSTYNVVLPYTLYIDPVYNTFHLNNVQQGTYTFLTTNVCGQQFTQSVTVDAASSILYLASAIGCENNRGSIVGGSDLQSVIIIAAPQTYSNLLPHNVSNQIDTFGYFVLNDLPSGIYTVSITDICGNNLIEDIEIGEVTEIVNVDIIRHCGSFDINLNFDWIVHPLNFIYTNKFWLQRLNPITNEWENPASGSVYVPGTLLNNLNSIELFNNSINYNFAYQGTFRIIKSFHTVQGNCVKSIYQFNYNGLPQINDVYSFACSNSTYDVIINASGVAPLQYRIVEKNGQPFVVENSNSPVFLGLPAAHYKFQVEDGCGNILNSEFDIPRPFSFVITPTSFCDGQPASFTVPNFDILEYQWWKDNDVTNILSTTNTLQFPSFNYATDVGVYHVRVWYNNPNSCIDFVLDYQIHPSSNIVNAGQNNTVSYCGNQGVINLNSLIIGTYTTGGAWQELSNSGTLTGNLWNSLSVDYGTYQFEYTVNGSCGTSDSSLITITIKEIPQTPVASVNPIICDTQNLELFATTIPNVTYSWTGPNGFTSTQQNPVIASISSLNSGIYSVKVTKNGCDSTVSSVNVSVNSLPQFSISGECNGNNYIITATPEAVSSMALNWSGPNGYTSNSSSITITGLPIGIYSLTATDVNGCSTTNSINVIRTICEIPNGISPNGDGSNDNFNLAGFDVKKIKIFNRYGMLVYELTDYLDQWHGQTKNGNILPSGTYYYYLELGNGEAKTGWVYLALTE